MTSSLPGGPTAQLQQLITNSCLTVPDVLTVVPLINQRQQQQQQQQEGVSQLAGCEIDAGSQEVLGEMSAAAAEAPTTPTFAALLFLGSKSSSSQVVGLALSCLQAASSGPQQGQQEKSKLCYMLQSAFLPSLAGAQAVTVMTDPTGDLLILE
jgi:hypothetical protein